ncbi:MAG: gamma-glutamyltransferase [Actinomycetota bacterium]|nr:gamma-glutamyltransferase [Actinomycetota bacterium]
MFTPAAVHGPPGSAAVAAGSAEAAGAAVEALRSGGSAVDAALAAALAAAVSEPVLTSLGGGGFLLHAEPGRAAEVLDFFVAVPGLGQGGAEPHVARVVIDFASGGPAATASEQAFHVGWGTVAVPGCFAGYAEAHRRWGRLPLAALLAPATHLARAGVGLAPVQLAFERILRDLLLLTPDSRALFADVDATGRYANRDYARLLEAWGSGSLAGPDDPAYAGRLLEGAHAGGGLIGAEDLAAYSPVLREALAVRHRGVEISTNPGPSAGGRIVLDALSRLSSSGAVAWGDLVTAQADAVEAHRGRGQVPTGTTHISVVDAGGTVAALSTSNGSGSGTVVPHWGIPLNNMLGEEDLRPGDPLPPGARMGSMMAPTMLRWPDGSTVAMGTGGSERIRSALVCCIARLVEDGASLEEAIAGPRAHVAAEGVVHLEPGFPQAAIDEITSTSTSRGWPAPERWPQQTVFFGGVHAVSRAAEGSVRAVGDTRRGGAAAVLLPDGSIHVA